VRPQLGLLKSTMLQLDSTFNEKAYGAGSFTDFVEKLQKADFVEVTGGEGRYMIRMKGGGAAPEKPGHKPEEASPCCATCWKRTAWRWTTARWPTNWPNGCARSSPNSTGANTVSRVQRAVELCAG